jgi:L-fuconolactonase
VIDSHAHLWRLGENGCTWPTPDLEPIHRDFVLDDLRAVANAVGVDGVILVQSQPSLADTEWLLGLATDPLIAGVVGWADLTAPDAMERIRSLAQTKALRGLRPMVQDLESDWYDAPELDHAFAMMSELNLVLDGLVRPKHMPSLRRLAERHPQLGLVIDHGAKPDFDDLNGWRNEIGRIARLPNVTCKFSGLLTELPPGAPPQAINPAFEILWDCFGSERLIWGSDWPVLTLVGGYGAWLSQAQKLVPAEHHNAVFGGNAHRVYRIAA